jgi:hypothetical protein
MKTEYTEWKELLRAIDGLQGGWSEWTYECRGENLGTREAVITSYSIRRRTDEEKAQCQRDMHGLIEADLNSRTPLFGGRS